MHARACACGRLLVGACVGHEHESIQVIQSPLEDDLPSIDALVDDDEPSPVEPPVDNAQCTEEHRKFEPGVTKQCVAYCDQHYSGKLRDDCKAYIKRKRRYASCQPNPDCVAKHGVDWDFENPQNNLECKMHYYASSNKWGLEADCKICFRENFFGFFCYCKELESK